MKMDAKKWTRAGVLMTLAACLVVGLSGCMHDDDDDLIVPSGVTWEITWTNDDSGQSPLTLVVPIDDLNQIPDVQESFNGYTIEITRSGSAITIQIWDWGNGTKFGIFMTGTIATDGASASGSYTGTSENGSPLSGSWSIVKK